MKEVDIITAARMTKGLIVGSDPDIGITIVEKGRPDYYLVCLNGPLSPLSKGAKGGIHKEPIWSELYGYCHEMIKEGCVNLTLLRKFLEEISSKEDMAGVGRDGSSEYCPYSQ